MSCDLPHRASGGDAAKPDRVTSICCVPAPGALPSQLLLGTESGKVHMWDLRRQDALWTVAQLPERVLGVAASRDGSRVVMGTQHGQVRAGRKLPKSLAGACRTAVGPRSVAAGPVHCFSPASEAVSGCPATARLPVHGLAQRRCGASQVAMLDWSQPLSGQQGAQATPPYVTHWTSYNPMFVWPKLERGVLRMTCADVVSGPFLQPA